MAIMMGEQAEQPTARDILDAVFRSQDVLASSLGRLEAEFREMRSDVAILKSDVAILKSDVATLKSDVAVIRAHVDRLERRVIRVDDRLSAIETLNPGPMLADHERRIARLEGF
jgi:polyhydroxyalkanoate synthesis regulator phasin